MKIIETKLGNTTVDNTLEYIQNLISRDRSDIVSRWLKIFNNFEFSTGKKSELINFAVSHESFKCLHVLVDDPRFEEFRYIYDLYDTITNGDNTSVGKILENYVLSDKVCGKLNDISASNHDNFPIIIFLLRNSTADYLRSAKIKNLAKKLLELSRISEFNLLVEFMNYRHILPLFVYVVYKKKNYDITVFRSLISRVKNNSDPDAAMKEFEEYCRDNECLIKARRILRKCLEYDASLKNTNSVLN